MVAEELMLWVGGVFIALFIALRAFSRFTKDRLPRKLTGKAYVTDGDTIKVKGHTIRLHGIDAPELNQSHGRNAKSHLWRLIGGRKVTCRPIVRDQYGRLVAKCELDGIDLNREMVRDGYAHAYLRYSRDYEAEEAEARRERRGLWTRGWAINPEQWRRS